MFKTRITELFGIEHPIVGGCMMHISTPSFVAAVSNAGGLGVLASAMCATQDEFRRAIQLVRALTDRPFAVNLSLFPALRPIDNALYVEVILEERVPVVETSGHRPPEEMIATLKAAGVKTMHKCVSPKHARSAERAGVDAVTVFGSEGGGHIGELGLTTMTLVPETVDTVDIPVIAAGGIVDGRGLLAALALGAEGVTMGTRLLLSEECPIHDNLKQALLKASSQDTLPILGSLHNTLRAWHNEAARKVAEIEARGGDMWEILAVASGDAARRMYDEGNIDAGVMACSQAIGRVQEILPVSRIFQNMVNEAARIRDGLGHTV